MALDCCVVRQPAVLLVGAVDDAHAVGDEVGHVEDAALGEQRVVPAIVQQLVVRPAADDLRLKHGNRLGLEYASQGVGREDVTRLAED